MEVIFVIFSVWLTVTVIKAIFRGLKRLFLGPPKKAEDEKQKSVKNNSQAKKSPDLPPKATGQNAKPKTEQKKTTDPAKAAKKTAQKAAEPAKTAQKTAQKAPEPAKTVKKEPESAKKPAPEEKKMPPREPQKNLPLCCAKCGAPLPAAKCPACGFDHKKTPIIYLGHPPLSQ